TYAAQWNSDERPVIAGNQLVSYNGYYGGIGSWSPPGLGAQWNHAASIYEEPGAAMDGTFIYAYGSSTYNSNTQIMLRSTGAFQGYFTNPLGLYTSSPI